jgi:hypothetical protein
MLPLSGLLSLPTKERGTVPLPLSLDILPMDSALDRKWDLLLNTVFLHVDRYRIRPIKNFQQFIPKWVERVLQASIPKSIYTYPRANDRGW